MLRVSEIRHGYGRHLAISHVSLDLERGEIGCIVGPSGAGKTTLLRTIAGLEVIQDGEIVIENTVVSRKGWVLPPACRNIGMTFQERNLFPHMTVSQNIAFGLWSIPRKQRAVCAEEWMKRLELVGKCGCYPHELSVGEQQRVALARALAPRPALLLMDEPFCALDRPLRLRIIPEIRDILRTCGQTALVVTHDCDEVGMLGDRMGVMENGYLVSWEKRGDGDEDGDCIFRWGCKRSMASGGTLAVDSEKDSTRYGVWNVGRSH